MSGKISLQDLPREDIYCSINYDNQLLPEFMNDMTVYMDCLDIIAKTNFIEDAEPEDCIRMPVQLKLAETEDEQSIHPEEESNKSVEKNDSYFASEGSNNEMTGTHLQNGHEEDDFSKIVRKIEAQALANEKPDCLPNNN